MPALTRPQAMNVRNAFYGLIAITSLGLAPAMPVAAANPAPASVSHDEMVNWLADGERGLWIQVNTLEWFTRSSPAGAPGSARRTRSFLRLTHLGTSTGGAQSPRPEAHGAGRTVWHQVNGFR